MAWQQAAKSGQTGRRWQEIHLQRQSKIHRLEEALRNPKVSRSVLGMQFLLHHFLHSGVASVRFTSSSAKDLHGFGP